MASSRTVINLSRVFSVKVALDSSKFLKITLGKVPCRCVASSPRPAQAGTAEASQSPPPRIGNAGAPKAEKISKAMKAYIERATKHNEFMDSEIAEYEIGRRHLANIMGEDPDTFSQEMIDEAIEYLLPSGLFDKKARPQLKHPFDVIPKRKAAAFAIDGRPFHHLFYTGFPQFYEIMHEAADKYLALNKHEDTRLSKGLMPDKSQKLIMTGSKWLEKSAIEAKVQERISDEEYGKLITLLERLGSHPYAYQDKEFVMSYRVQLVTQALISDITKPKQDEDGREYMEASAKRKTCIAEIKIWNKGTGRFTVNGKDILTAFPLLIDREQIMFPLQFCGKLGEVDIMASVVSGGSSGQAGALRLALATALQSFVPIETVEQMRLAGLLTSDPRKKERNKPGQAGARKKFTWKKR